MLNDCYAFAFKINFFIKSFNSSIRVSNGLETDCKGYQQLTKIAANKKRAGDICMLLNIACFNMLKHLF